MTGGRAASAAAAPVLAPTVSVVIPVRNDAELLRRCLRALDAQTVAPLEVIVVNNGSTDATDAVAREHGARLVDESEIGIAAASAAGYDAAIGDVLARLDADSVPAPDWIATISTAFATRRHVAAITGPAAFTDGPTWLRAPVAAVYLSAYFLLTGLALGHVPLFGSNLAMRSEAWRSVRTAVHDRDTLIHDDLDLSFHLGVEHALRLVPGLQTGISMRPFTEGGWRLRWRRGFHTVAVHWPHDLPWLRVWRRMMLLTATRSAAPVMLPTLPDPDGLELMSTRDRRSI